ncbi:MAG: hypothetical protein ACRDFW_08820 [bacterium]
MLARCMGFTRPAALRASNIVPFNAFDEHHAKLIAEQALVRLTPASEQALEVRRAAGGQRRVT